jgi:hypothetical protein
MRKRCPHISRRFFIVVVSVIVIVVAVIGIIIAIMIAIPVGTAIKKAPTIEIGSFDCISPSAMDGFVAYKILSGGL